MIYYDFECLESVIGNRLNNNKIAECVFAEKHSNAINLGIYVLLYKMLYFLSIVCAG